MRATRCRPAAWILALGTALILAVCGPEAPPPEPATPGPDTLLVRGYYPGDTAMWGQITLKAASFSLPRGLKGLVVPHHLSEQFELAGVWKAVARAARPSVVVLLSPDHFLAGQASITLPGDVGFDTAFGYLPADRELSDALLREDSMRAQASGLYTEEHGVHTHAPFVAYYLPGTRFLPILIKPGTDTRALDQLMVDLRDTLPRDSLVVASVDFSHYNPVAFSRFHDAMSEAALEAMDASRILGAEVDSPESLYLLTLLMKSMGVDRANVFHRTDLQDHFEEAIGDNTSHVYASYGPGRSASVPTVTILALPSVAGDKDAPFQTLRSWTWDWRDPDRTARTYPALAELAGAGHEDRRFMGSDLYLFGSEGEQRERLDVGHSRVSVLRAPVDWDGAYDRLLVDAAIERKDGRRPVIVLAECGNRYGHGDAFDAAAWEADMKALAKAGADVVISRSPDAPGWLERHWGNSVAVLLPGWLVPPNGVTADRGAAAAGLVWNPSGGRLWRFDISHRTGVPVWAGLPAAKSYDTPVVSGGRE